MWITGQKQEKKKSDSLKICTDNKMPMKAVFDENMEEIKMVNMSYCRFQNTAIALDECIDSLNDENVLSVTEKRYCKSLFQTFLNFCVEEGIVEDEDGERDDRLKEFIDGLETE